MAIYGLSIALTNLTSGVLLLQKIDQFTSEFKLYNSKTTIQKEIYCPGPTDFLFGMRKNLNFPFELMVTAITER